MGSQYGKNYGGGRNSKKFRNGSNDHIGGTRSHSGLPSYGSKPSPKPQRSNGPSIGEILFGPGPRNNSHGPGTRKKKR